MKFLKIWVVQKLASLSHRSAVRSVSFGLLCSVVLFGGCTRKAEVRKASILLGPLPSAVLGGPDPLGRIMGKVVDGEPGAKIVLYARSDAWYVQPFKKDPFTNVAEDGSWNNITHLGLEYAALLVRVGYQPHSKMQSLPAVGGDILAVASGKGTPKISVKPKVIHFSGYDWDVSSSLVDRGGQPCDYDPDGVWVDEKGALHLRTGPREGRWRCAGISLNRSLGYGMYRFVISDTARLPISPVLAIFTRTDAEEASYRTGLGLQFSRWGKSAELNADYVVSPYYVPGHVAHFIVPPGQMTHTVRWSPEMAEFKTFAGTALKPTTLVNDHVFRSGVPVASFERVRLDFYDFQHSKSALKEPVEVVVQKFDYLP